MPPRMNSAQIVILAGGMATRLRPLTEAVPKSMLPVNGVPFLEHQLCLLRRHGVTDIVLCIGYLGDAIKGYFGDGRRFGLQISYSEEKGRLLGTAGAVKQAQPLLREEFFVTYGDSYLMLDYGEIMAYFRRSHKLGLMVVLRNEDRWDRSNVVVADGLVEIYDKRRRLPGMVHIDEGLSLLRKEALSLIPDGAVMDLEEFHQALIRQRELMAYEVQQRFYEIGSLRGLEEFRQLVSSGALS